MEITFRISAYLRGTLNYVQNTMKKLLVMALFTSTFCHAQDSNVPRTLNTRNLSWIGLLGEYKFNDRWSAVLDAQFRYEYTDGDIFQWTVRPCATWKSKKGLLLSPGISYWQLYPNPNGTVPRPEFRPWQEVGKKYNVGNRHTLYPRIRFEQRFIREYAGSELAENYSFHSFRLRLRMDYTYNLQPAKAQSWLLVAGNEIMFFQKTNGFSGFDQNRAWAGGGYKFNAHHTVQLHYLNLYLQKNSTSSDMFHVIRALWIFTWTQKPKGEVVQ